jgi:hypothetical protein
MIVRAWNRAISLATIGHLLQASFKKNPFLGHPRASEGPVNGYYTYIPKTPFIIIIALYSSSFRSFRAAPYKSKED